MGLLQHSPRRITKPYTAFCDQEVACSQTLSRICKLWKPGPGGPGPVARSRPGPGARSRWPGPGGPVSVARSRWPGPRWLRSRWPGSRWPRSRWPGPGPALRARCPWARAKKDLFWSSGLYPAMSNRYSHISEQLLK